MTELTKEWLLRTIAELEEERDAVPGVVNEDAAKALAAMKLALASLEAEPVAFRSKLQPPSAIGSECWDYTDHRQPDAFELENCVIERLYTAPPAQEVPEVYNIGDATMRHIFTPAVITDVSDMQAVFDQIETVLAGMWQPATVVDEDLLHMAASAIEDLLSNKDQSGAGVWADLPVKLRRAAMLQGAEPVTTAYKLPFEQWLSQQTGTIDVECGCVMTEVFFHWLRVAYEAGNSPVIPDGWVACSERMPEEGDDMIVFTDEIVMSGVSYSKKKGFYLQALEYDDDEPVDNVTHWMPLPASPQQEVK